MIHKSKCYISVIFFIQALGYTYSDDLLMTPIQQLRVERQENYELYLFRKDFLIYDDDDVRKAVFETLMKEQFTKEIKGRIV